MSHRPAQRERGKMSRSYSTEDPRYSSNRDTREEKKQTRQDSKNDINNGNDSSQSSNHSNSSTIPDDTRYNLHHSNNRQIQIRSNNTTSEIRSHIGSEIRSHLGSGNHIGTGSGNHLGSTLADKGAKRLISRHRGEARILSPSPSYDYSGEPRDYIPPQPPTAGWGVRGRPRLATEIITTFDGSDGGSDHGTSTTRLRKISPDPSLYKSREQLPTPVTSLTTTSVKMCTPTRVVLCLCGSFNPITNMHLRMFELARDSLHKTGMYRVVGGIVSPVSDAYSKEGLVSAHHRCTMVEKALSSSDWIRLDTWESDQDAWSRTLTVLRHHRQQLESKLNSSLNNTPQKKRKLDRNDSPDEQNYPNNLRNLNESPVQLKLLCGADLLESFATPDLWKSEDLEEICTQYGLVVISRAGSEPDKFVYESDLLSKNRKHIHMITEWITNDISSTKIRRSLRRGDSVKYLVQDSVIDYVVEQQLYGAGDNKLMNYTVSTPVTASPNNDDIDDFPSSPPASPISVGRMDSRSCGYLSPQHYHDLDARADQGEHYHSDDAILQDIRRYRRMNNNRAFHSEDSDDESLDRSPPLPRRPVSCMGADFTGLMRRVRNMRVGVTPETCV